MTPLEEMQWFCVAHMHFCVASGLARSHGFRQVEGSQQHHVNTEHRTHVYAYTEDCQLMSARQQPAHVACQGQTCTLNLVHASLAPRVFTMLHSVGESDALYWRLCIGV